MTALLASVRDLAEAELAVAAGCDWLDLKEPRAGALGAVADAVIGDVAARYSAHLPISATIGDCWETPASIPIRVTALARTSVDYVKIGLFASACSPDLDAALRDAVAIMPNTIAVCFAEAPPTQSDLVRLASIGFKGVMLDTADKTRGPLTAHMTAFTIAAFIAGARQLGLMTGLAGSLRASDVPALLKHGADYLGFRGALCAGEQREATLDRDAIERIRGLIPKRPAA